MHQVNNAAGFIYANMPLGKGKSLTEQDAWDVAMFMDSHERPQDPRFKGNVAETRKKFHDSDESRRSMVEDLISALDRYAISASKRIMS